MNKYLLVGFLVAVAAVGSARAQSFRAPVNDERTERAQRPPPPLYRDKVVGAFPRAARGNPLQLLNPRAPQKYRGAPQDTVSVDDSQRQPQRNQGESPNRFAGVVLFGIRW